MANVGDNNRDRPLDEVHRARPKRFPARVRPLPYANGQPVQRFDTGEHIGLVEIDWDTGTEYYSFTGIRSPNAYYDDLITAISPIRRSVSVTGESLSAGTATVNLYNRSRTFSIKWATTSIRGRAIRIKFVSIPLGLASAITLFSGFITGYKLQNEEFIVTAADTYFDQLFNTAIPLGGNSTNTIPLVNTSIFPNLLDGQMPVMTPLIMGRFKPSTYTSNLGAVPAFLVDTSGGGGYPFVYVIAARVISATKTSNLPVHYGGSVAVTGIYTAGSTSITSLDGTARTFPTFVFQQEQRSATRLSEIEISGLVSGFTETDDSTTDPILNPVRALEYLLETYTSLTASNFDSTLETTANASAVSQGYADDYDRYASNSVPLALFEADPARTWLNLVEDLCASFAMALYTTRYGKLAVFVPTSEADPVPDFTVTDETDIIKDSFIIQNNPDTATIILCPSSYRWTYGQRGDLSPGAQPQRNIQYIIPGEKARAGNFETVKSINLPFNGSAIATAEVARVFAEHYKSQAQIIDFDLPIYWFRWADLNRYIGITHWQGTSAVGGYANITARIIGIETTVQPTSAHIHLTCFKRASATTAFDDFIRADSVSLGTSWYQSTAALTIKSNRLVMVGTSISYGHGMRTEAYGNNQLARALFSTSFNFGTDNSVHGIGVRVSGVASNMSGYFAVYEVYNNGTSYAIRLYKLVNTDLTLLNNVTLLATAYSSAVNAIGALFGCGIEIRVDGTTIDIFAISDNAAFNGRLMSSVTDSDIASGAPGFVCWRLAHSSDSSTWDRFHCRDF